MLDELSTEDCGCCLTPTHVLVGDWYNQLAADQVELYPVTYLGEAQTSPPESPWWVLTCNDADGGDDFDKAACAGGVYWLDNQGNHACEYHGTHPPAHHLPYTIRPATHDEPVAFPIYE